MTSSSEKPTRSDSLPPALSSMWRLCKLGYRHEPNLIVASFTLALLAALPDALLAFWFKLLGEGALQRDWSRVRFALLTLGVSATATWFLQTVSVRVQRRFRDKVTIALESHVATLIASIATIAHQERPEYLDRLSVLRNQVFMLDHMYMSLFTTCGWILRLGVTIALLVSIHPALALLALFALPPVLTSTWRPGVERSAFERGASSSRLARHLFDVATTAAPGKEVRVTGIGDRLVRERRQAWESGNRPIAAARWASAGWHTLAWAMFGAGYVGAIVFVSSGLAASAGDVLLTLAAGSRLSFYVGGAVGEVGFLRIWMDSSRRLAWLEDYASACAGAADQPAPDRLAEGIRFDHVSFAYPGTERLVLDDVNLALPAGAVVAIVGENGAGKVDARQAAGEDVRADERPHPRRSNRPRAHFRRGLARTPRRRLSGFLPVRVPRASDRRRRRSAAPRRGDRRRHRGEPGRRRRCDRSIAGRSGYAARAHVARWRRGELWPVAEAGARARLHARPAARAGARRTDRRARC